MIAVVALIAFVIWERRTPEPIVNLRVLANRNFAVGTTMIATVGIALYGTTALLALRQCTKFGPQITRIYTDIIAPGWRTSRRGRGR